MHFTGFSLKKSVQSVKRLPARFRRSLSEYRFIAYLAVLGPGIIAANAGNDASGIATYSTVGAGYGYTMLWLFIPMTIALIVVQEMCVRMGVVTGQGLADLIREQFGVRLTALVMLALLVANSGVIVSEFVGIAQASELFGILEICDDSCRRRFDLVARRQRFGKARRESFSFDVARFFRLYFFGVSFKTGLGNGRQGIYQTEFFI